MNKEVQLFLDPCNVKSIVISTDRVIEKTSETLVDGGRLRRRHGGITNIFPIKLHSMLQDIERDESHIDIISWCKDGNSFIIKKPDEFTKYLLPTYFRTNRMSSFQRQLNAYGFSRFNLYTSEENVHIYYHSSFHRYDTCQLGFIKRRSKVGCMQVSAIRQEQTTTTGWDDGNSFRADGCFNFLSFFETPLEKADLDEGVCKDLALDQAAAAVSLYDGDDLCLMEWNPELEALSDDSDYEYDV
jgi:HSF-type DNA-binding